jgi:N-lysine methyltransferase SETD6
VDEEPSSEGGADEQDEDKGEDPRVNTLTDSSMHLDDACPEGPNEEMNSDESDDEEDDPSDVAMVPMADILNARWGSENVSQVLSDHILHVSRFMHCVCCLS